MTTRDELRALAAARALVAHWDDPHSGSGDGRFDAERWENRRDELEAALREALMRAEPVGPSVMDPDRSPQNREAAGW